jgi:energy-converting hydrogenase A subunit M
MYMKTKDLGWKENYGIQNTGTEGSQENIMLEMRQVLRIWQKYMAELYGRSNRPENLEVEPGEEVGADKESLYTLHSVVEKATEEMKDNKATGDDDVPGD